MFTSWNKTKTKHNLLFSHLMKISQICDNTITVKPSKKFTNETQLKSEFWNMKKI